MAARRPGSWLGVSVVTLAAAIVVWAVYDNGRRLYRNWYMHGDGAALETSTSTDTVAIAAPGYDVSRIIDAHLFGQDTDAPQAELAHVPETRLKINLLGLIASADRQFARAFVDVNGSRAKSYSIGDQFDETDAAVQAVEPDRVLLKRGSAVESLVLKRQDISSGEALPSPGIGDDEMATLPQASPLEDEAGYAQGASNTDESTADAGPDPDEVTIQQDDRTIELRKLF